MLMYAWMVWMERAPKRYDWAVKLMTLGRIDRIKREIAAQIKPGDRVLDVGCGPGALGLMCLSKGASVVGLDTSDFMLEEFRRRTSGENYGERLQLVKDSATQLGERFAPNSFDAIVSTMAIGEFPKEYIDYIFKAAYGLLKPGGRVLIADEVWPTNPLVGLVYLIVMGITYLPQFVILRRITWPIRNLVRSIAGAGFRVERVKNYPMSTFQLVAGTK